MLNPFVRDYTIYAYSIWPGVGNNWLDNMDKKGIKFKDFDSKLLKL